MDGAAKGPSPDSPHSEAGTSGSATPNGGVPGDEPAVRARPRPVLRVAGEPSLAVAADGTAVMRYPFELRANGNRVVLSATFQVMTGDGESLESDAPGGWVAPPVRSWTREGVEHVGETLEVSPDDADGAWTVEVPIVDDMVVGVDISSEVVE